MEPCVCVCVCVCVRVRVRVLHWVMVDLYILAYGTAGLCCVWAQTHTRIHFGPWTHCHVLAMQTPWEVEQVRSSRGDDGIGSVFY